MTNFKLLLCSQPALPTSVNLTLSAGKQAQATSGVPVSSSTHPLPPLFLPCNTPSVRSLTNLTYLNLIYSCPLNARAFPGGSASLKKKNPPANAGNARDTGSIPRLGRSPEKEMATHSSILAWRISWTEEPGGLQFMGSQRVGHYREHRHACTNVKGLKRFWQENQIIWFWERQREV